jgi:hypothetical protein
MIAAKKDDAVLGIELDDMVQVNPLQHKAAGVFANGLSRGAYCSVSLGINDRINRLVQVQGVTLDNLTMRQNRQQHACRYQTQDNMETSRRQCYPFAKYSAKIVQMNSTASEI